MADLASGLVVSTVSVGEYLGRGGLVDCIASVGEYLGIRCQLHVQNTHMIQRYESYTMIFREVSPVNTFLPWQLRTSGLNSISRTVSRSWRYVLSGAVPVGEINLIILLTSCTCKLNLIQVLIA